MRTSFTANVISKSMEGNTVVITLKPNAPTDLLESDQIIFEQNDENTNNQMAVTRYGAVMCNNKTKTAYIYASINGTPFKSSVKLNPASLGVGTNLTFNKVT